MGNPSLSYEASSAIWDNTALSATQHRWTCPIWTWARFLIYLLWRDGSLSWPRHLVIYRDGYFFADSHPSK